MIPAQAVEAAAKAYIALRAAADYKMPHEYAKAMLDAAAPYITCEEDLSEARAQQARGQAIGTMPSLLGVPTNKDLDAAKDELAALIWATETESLGTFTVGPTSEAADKIADVVIAAGYRKVSK